MKNTQAHKLPHTVNQIDGSLGIYFHAVVTVVDKVLYIVNKNKKAQEVS